MIVPTCLDRLSRIKNGRSKIPKKCSFSEYITTIYNMNEFKIDTRWTNNDRNNTNGITPNCRGCGWQIQFCFKLWLYKLRSMAYSYSGIKVMNKQIEIY